MATTTAAKKPAKKIVPHIPGFPGGVSIAGNVGKQFAYTLVDEITKALKDSGAKNIAQALVSKIGQEVSYAKNISSGIKSGLNLAGMFEFSGGPLASLGQGLAARGGTAGAFFTGVLAVIVATPCTAPFMAAALGFALGQPAPQTVAVLLATPSKSWTRLYR